MNNWWRALAPRERLTVSLGVGAAVLVLGFLLVVEPALDRRQNLADRLHGLYEEVDWMRAQAPAVRAASAGPEPLVTKPSARPAGSLLAVVDASARAAGLGEALRRVRPQGAAVFVELERAPYGNLMQWFSVLETENSLRIISLSMGRAEAPGFVSAQLRVEPAH